MSRNPRKLFSTLVAGLIPALCSSVSSAQVYPQKPVRLIVSAPVGTAPDIMARLLGDKLDQTLGQRVIVDNRPTAQGLIAVKALREAAADGYTLGFLQAAAAVVTPFTYRDANYDIERDLETVATVAYTPMLLVANGKAPATALADLQRIAKTSKPETIVVGNPIRASIPHLAAELLAERIGAKIGRASCRERG